MLIQDPQGLDLSLGSPGRRVLPCSCLLNSHCLLAGHPGRPKLPTPCPELVVPFGQPGLTGQGDHPVVLASGHFQALQALPPCVGPPQMGPPGALAPGYTLAQPRPSWPLPTSVH